MFVIPQSQLDLIGFDLAAAVEDFTAKLEAHAQTEGEFAPRAHPLVEQVVREGGLRIEDDRAQTEALRVANLRASKSDAIAAQLRDQMNAIASPARRQLAQMDLAEISAKPTLREGGDAVPGIAYRTGEEQAQANAAEAMFRRINEMHRHALRLHIEMEELPNDQLESWEPHGWPAA